MRSDRNDRKLKMIKTKWRWIVCRNEGIKIRKNEKSTLEFKFEELISHSKTLGIFADYSLFHSEKGQGGASKRDGIRM